MDTAWRKPRRSLRKNRISIVLYMVLSSIHFEEIFGKAAGSILFDTVNEDTMDQVDQGVSSPVSSLRRQIATFIDRAHQA